MTRKYVKAYTLAELVIVVVIISAMAAIVIPRFNFAIISDSSADAFAQKIKTDLRRTRSMAISNAATNSAGYSLRIVGRSYEIIDLSSMSVVDSHDIPKAVNVGGHDKFEFGPLGNLKVSSGSQMTITTNGNTFSIEIIQATGMVKCTEN